MEQLTHFTVKFDDMSKRNQQVVNEVERQLMTSKQQTKAAIKDMVEMYVVKKLSEYEKVLKAFGKFFNSDELQRQMDKKVDIEALSKILGLKASKKELDSTVLIVENVF